MLAVVGVQKIIKYKICINHNYQGIITKTCTINPKIGNPEINYYYDKNNHLHFNCKGLPNKTGI